ncbi:MAG: hypothetical protein J6W64_04210 [Bacilli bacterium]|nr:hypothetical protein [Bacilli bacterium]MBO7518642.1 hypothetical protein [Methanobrevibacter sp.]
MTSTADGSVMWSINQITDPSLSITAENSQAVDALGSPIATFNRNKQAEFTANNSLFDLGLYAAQNGVEKEVATAVEKIVTPIFETIKVPATASTPVALAHEPIVAPTEIYQLKGDGTMGEKLVYSATAGAGKFTYDSSTHEITFPSAAVAGTEYFVQYEYESESAVAVTGDAINFPKAGKFIMEVLGTDVCDPSTLIHAYIVFPNAKLDANVDVSFTTDGNHPFTIQAQQSYCDSKKVLFQIVIPEED